VGEGIAFRSVLVRPGRELLQGRVDVDETYIGGEEPGLAGGPREEQEGHWSASRLSALSPRGLGRCRMAWLLDGSSASLHAFLIDHVQQGATVISDGWQPYRPATKDLYVHDRVVVPGAKASDLLPGVHRIASLAQRWLLGTHQGTVEEPHLSSYLDEFVFPFNRRRSRSRGMVFYRVLELAVAHDPVRYRHLILNPRPSITHRVAPATRRRPRASTARPPNRPWQSANAPSSGQIDSPFVLYPRLRTAGVPE
jgi:hypothetical protein